MRVRVFLILIDFFYSFRDDKFFCRRSLFMEADSIMIQVEALNFHFGKAPNRMKRRQRRRFRVLSSWKLVINFCDDAKA
jgi:hypothetical protein